VAPGAPVIPAIVKSAAVAIDVVDARVVYEGTPVFERLSLRLDAGATTCLLGPSGVGKSSLLRLLAGLIPLDRGRVAAADGAPLAGRVAFMDQRDLLLPWLSAEANVGLGARLRGEPVDRARVAALLAAVGVAARAAARPAALSGGERQRVALARTLMEDRPIILMDEPFSAVDALTRLKLQDLAAELFAGRTVVVVTHDPLEAIRMGHRILVMAGAPARIGASYRVADPMPRDVTAFADLHRGLLAELGAGARPTAPTPAILDARAS
jgi:putative hydroxymethylpyrimidine transport system ATP-binding protein